MSGLKELAKLQARAAIRREHSKSLEGQEVTLADGTTLNVGIDYLRSAESDLDIAFDIIDRLQQVKIPPLLFGEQLLRDALAMRTSLQGLCPKDAPILEQTEWMEEYRSGESQEVLGEGQR